MLNWLRLISFLLFCAVVYGKEVECDDVEYGDFCWNSTGVNFIKKCWRCQINEQQLATNESLIVSGKFEYLNIERVKIGGSITEIPNMFQKFTNKPIVEVSLFYKTKTTVLNSSFFVNSGENLIVFYVTMVEGLSVEGLTFQNCSSLEYLVLSFISLKIIPFDAFFGLNQLIMLDLGFNSLKNLHSKLFRDLENLKQLNLQANNLEEIPKDAFNKLKKLRKLDLYNNNITTISRKMFESNKQLNSINLGKNKIKIIQLDTFKYLNKLTKLYLKENNCTEMIFNNKPLVEVAEALTPCYPTNCIIPIIQNGHVISMKDNSTQTPGYFFKMFQSVKVICNPTYVLFNGKANQTGNKCLEQEWQEIEWPECVREYFEFYIFFGLKRRWNNIVLNNQFFL